MFLSSGIAAAAEEPAEDLLALLLVLKRIDEFEYNIFVPGPEFLQKLVGFGLQALELAGKLAFEEHVYIKRLAHVLNHGQRSIRQRIAIVLGQVETRKDPRTDHINCNYRRNDKKELF